MAMRQEALPLLLQALREGRSIERQVAAKLLGRIGDPRAETLLLRTIANRDFFAAGAARRGLAALYQRFPEKELIARMGEFTPPDWGEESMPRETKAMMTLAAVYGAYKRAEDLAPKKPVLPAKVEAEVCKLVDHPSAEVRTGAATALGYGLDPLGTERLFWMIRSIDEEATLAAALRSLRRLRPTEGREAVALLTEHRSLIVALEAWAVLDAMGEAGTVAAIEKFLEAPDWRVRRRAIRILQTVRGHDVADNAAGDVVGGTADVSSTVGPIEAASRQMVDIQALARATRDEHWAVRHEAVAALEAVGGVARLPELHQCLDDTDPRVRARAAVALARLGSAGWLRPLLDDLEGPEVTATRRLQAARALGEIGRPEGVRALSDALEDPDLGVACAAAEALGRIGERTAAGALYAALQSSKPPLSSVARQALQAVIGEDPGGNPADWPRFAEVYGIDIPAP